MVFIFRRLKNNVELIDVDGLQFEKHYLTDELDEQKKIFAIVEKKGNRANTFESIKMFKHVRELFGTFKTATITNREPDISNFRTDEVGQVMTKLVDDYNEYLVLIDENGNQLHLTGCKSGYAGTGPHGTYEILEELNFKVDMRYIISCRKFKLHLPKFYEDTYGLKV